MSAPSKTFDYIICGGGTVGCVLASRISQAGHSVLVLEAGPENYSETIMSPLGGPMLHNTEFEYNYVSEPQKHLNGRRLVNFGGRVLSGSSGVNYGLWTRGHSADFDAWAAHVSDKRWSYKSMTKYFRRCQRHHDMKGDKDVYGFEGPISTSAGLRDYPLGKQVLAAFESCGVPFNKDVNGGSPLGVGAYTETWKDGKRQMASRAYDMTKVEVVTEAIVLRVDLEGEGDGGLVARGVTLVDGRSFAATKEVLVSCGAIRSPQLLMLSGVGPRAHLEEHGIKAIIDVPGVGQNFHDHISVPLFWKLQNPDAGLALGNAEFAKREGFMNGVPASWIATISADSDAGSCAGQPHEAELRGDTELIVFYGPICSPGTSLGIPPDGTHITTPVISLLPTSRGTLQLASSNPNEHPRIDPNYLETEADRKAIRAGLRLAMRLMTTTGEMQAVIAGQEVPPPGFEGLEPLTLKSTDKELDNRSRAISGSFFQNAGTCAMGDVVDSVCRVKGVEKLRVCDASVFPLPIAGHYQGPTYAFAEAIADIVLGRDG